VATFGRNSTSTTYTTVENQLSGSVFALTERGIVASLTADINCTTSAKNMKLQIYRHSDLALIAETVQVSVPVGHAQRTFTFATNPELQTDDYLLTAWSVSGTGNGQISYAVGTTSQGHTKTGTYGTAPNPLVTPTHNNYAYNIYATYTPVIISGSKLFFDTVDFDYEVTGVNPHCKCPNCQTLFQPQYKPIPSVSNMDYNAKSIFQCPNCGQCLELYVAFHKDVNGSNCCIQKSSEEGAGGIPANWWVIR
jgi:hypothetical protein